MPEPETPPKRDCDSPNPVGNNDNNNEVSNSLMSAAAAAANWYNANKNNTANSNPASMLPFLSLCSRYPGGPWAGILQQTMKEKQKQGTVLNKICLISRIFYALNIIIFRWDHIWHPEVRHRR